MKKVSAIIFLYLIVCSHAQSSTTLKCYDELSSGIENNYQQKTSKVAKFKNEKHKIKFNNDFSKLRIRTIFEADYLPDISETLQCQTSHNESYVVCNEKINGRTFIFSKTNKRYVYSQIYSHTGYAGDKYADDKISVGTCY